ncbi:dephospho-CoA kinase [bacterium]|nr:dephospho-CoA kinase [bacterium]
MIIIGIVGSPAGGKSTVAGHLADLGATWINADLIARSILNDPDTIEMIVHYFGSDVMSDEGHIDRKHLAARVFGDDKAKRSALTYLESVLHPRTRQRITESLQNANDSGANAVALEVPLLFESGWDTTCDEIWCVDATAERRQKWAKSRNWSAQDLRNRELNQIPIELKKRLSNQVMMNQGSSNDLKQLVHRHWHQLIQRPIKIDTRHCFNGLETK